MTALLPAQSQDPILEVFSGCTLYLSFTLHDFGNCHFQMVWGFCPVVLVPREGTSFFFKLDFLSFPCRDSTCLSSQSKGRKRSVF